MVRDERLGDVLARALQMTQYLGVEGDLWHAVVSTMQSETARKRRTLRSGDETSGRNGRKGLTRFSARKPDWGKEATPC